MAPSSKTLLLAAAAATIPQVSAWGALGHTTVAFLAQNFVSDKTAKFAQTLFKDPSNAYLANIATWADSYRYEPGASWSGVLHYIDALDAVPKKCDVIYERDCPEEGCIVSAIANYSSRAVTPAIGLEEQQKALKWVVHFLGDVHQPLHVENTLIGGNGINVTFNGAKTNLHAVWDTAIPQKAIGNFSIEAARAWAFTLTADIKHGKYKKESKKWLQGINVKKPIDSAMVWANDANAYICSTVLPNGPDPLQNKEVSGQYYETAIPVVTKQIAKAGYRLAAWLDAIVEESEKKKPHGPPGNMGPGKKHGPPQWKDDNGHYYKRGEFKLEPWMEAARQARRDFGSDCGCTLEAHDH